MIWMDINGGTALERQKLEGAFWFALSELMPRKQNLDVEVTISDLGDDACGYWSGEKGDTHFIDIQEGQEASDLVTALFHEMVHVRQCERNVPMDSTLPYYERPYELEAYKLQEELWNRYSKKATPLTRQSIKKDTTTTCSEKVEKKMSV